MKLTSFLTLILSTLFLISSTTVFAQGKGNKGGLPSLEARVAALETENAALQATVAQLLSALGSHTADPTAHHTAYTDAEAIAAVDPTGVLDLLWRNGTEVTLEGANLHVVNGMGATGSTNSLGNIIIGYNELRGSGDDRTGSHMLVSGIRNNYSTYGGIVVGVENETSGVFSSVSGGIFNSASGSSSSVSGGSGNTASGFQTAVIGGRNNTANGLFATVSGGENNFAGGQGTSVSGGKDNTAWRIFSSVTGGQDNYADGDYSTVLGGFGNVATGNYDIAP